MFLILSLLRPEHVAPAAVPCRARCEGQVSIQISPLAEASPPLSCARRSRSRCLRFRRP